MTVRFHYKFLCYLMTQKADCIYKINARPETKTSTVTHDMVLVLLHIFMIVATHGPRWAESGKFGNKKLRLEDGRSRKRQ